MEADNIILQVVCDSLTHTTNYWLEEYFMVSSYLSMNVGPCHNGMARPRVADGGTASNMEGSCE
jgi:hypothetical protein